MVHFIQALAFLILLTAASTRSGASPATAADSVKRAVNSRVHSALRTGHGNASSPAPSAPAGAAAHVPADAAPRAVQAPHTTVAAIAPVEPKHAPSAPHDELETPNPGDTWAALLEGNARFSDGKPRRRQLVNERRALVAGQHPRAIVLACSDSRCSPELVFDQTLGDLFVIRTAGNVADPIALGSIEYAVEHLHVPLLIVLGHGECGAVAATVAGGEVHSPNLRAIVGRIAPAVEMTRLNWPGEELMPHAVEANVQQSARDLLLGSDVLRAAASAGELRIVTAVYSFADGQVRPLP